MMVHCQVLFGFVETEDDIGLQRRGWRQRNRPKSIVFASSSYNDLIVLDDLDTIPCEESNTIIIAKLAQRDECACFEVVEDKCMLSSGC